MKRFLSLLLSLSLLPVGISVYAQKDITPESLIDYKAGEKYSNIIDPTHIGGFTYLCINNNQSLDYSLDRNAETIRWFVKPEYNEFSLTKNPSEFGFEGFEISPPRDKTYTLDFDVESGKTYVVSARIKNNGSSRTPYFGVSMNSTWDSSKIVYSNEYGKEGMALSANEWQDFKATITLPNDYIESASESNKAGGFYKRIYFGLNKAMPKDTSFLVDVSDKNAFYIAEEQPYDIHVSTNESTVRINKNSVVLSYEILNQIGTRGGLDQEVSWYALKGDRSAFEEKISFTDNKDGTVTATIDKDISDGEYIIAAQSKKYKNLIRCVKIAYASHSLDDNIIKAPENMIPDASKGHGTEYIQRNCTAVTIDSTMSENGRIFNRFLYNGTSSLIPDTKSGYFAGFEINAPAKSLGFVGNAGKTYAFSARLRRAGTSADAAFGIAMNDTWSTETVITTNEYGSNGLKLTDEWQDFRATITLPEGYKNNNLDIYSNAIYAGLPTGSSVGSGFDIDGNDKDSLYFAEEKPHEIILKCDKKDELAIGDEIDISAEVVNQIGITGTLSQDLNWYCLNGERTETISGIKLTKTIDGVRAEIESAINPENVFIVASSKDYGLVSSIGLAKNSRKAIYVSPDGSDSNSGTFLKPLATVAGAQNKIRSMRKSESDSNYDVIFRGGEYKFDNTVNFSSEDSAGEGGSVTYCAYNGEKVTFSGAMEIDLSQAKRVTDENILSSLKEDVRNKVYEIDLNKQNFPYSIAESEVLPTAQLLCGNAEYPSLYLEGEEQPLAEWPNGEGNFSTWTYKSKTAAGYTGSEPNRWGNAKNWWIGGYLMWDYQYVRLPGESVDTANKLLNVKTSDDFYMHEGRDDITHRYKVYNLLEEIDVPGEWYIDSNSMKLYYYAPYGLKGKLEISTLKNTMLELNNVKNVSFEGIEFTKTRGNAAVMTNCENVDFKNCTFTDIGADAIKMLGSVYAETDRDYWQRQFIDAAYNCEISDSIFCNIGGHAVVLDGGNVDTLQKGNNVVKNCIFSRCAEKIRNFDAILVNGCGNSVINNNISRTPFQAIRYYGNDHIISYNEIYGVRQESDDTGAIYCGRNTVQRGTVISYNYLHDLLSTQQLNFKHIPAIYWDDGQTGARAEYNIIKNAEIDVYTNGVDNVFSNNISVDIKQKHWYYKNQTSGNVAASNTNTDQNKFGGYIANKELYFGHYPNLKTITESNLRGSFLGNSLYKLNTVKNNLSVNGGDNAISYWTSNNNGNVSGNAEIDSFDGFADASNGDYRVKNSSEYGSLGVLNENFDISSVGVISENKLPDKEIKPISPQNNQTVNSETVHFMWNEIPAATKYVLEIASDSEFKNITAKKEVYYNYADIDLPKGDGSEYYWRITAQNISNDFKAEQQSATYKFYNGEKITAAASVSEDNFIDLKISNNYYKDGVDANIIIAEYDIEGNLINAQMYTEKLLYGTQTSLDGKKPMIKNPEKSSSVKLFIWNDVFAPLRNAVDIK